MPRAGLSPQAVVDAAVTLLDQQGPDALTLAGVAARTGVATPSLYKHVRNLAELRRLIGVRVLTELGDAVAQAALGRSRDEAVQALMTAYRDYVVRHPHRYAALPQQPVDDPETAASGTRVVEVILAVLAGYGLTGPDAIHATRCLRAAVHGFTTLETGGGFGLPEKLDDTFAMLTDMVTTSLHRVSEDGAGQNGTGQNGTGQDGRGPDA